MRLASLSLQAGDRAEAYRLVDEVLATEKTNIHALVGKAHLQFSDGRLDEAMTTVRAALLTDPSSFQAQYQLGVILSAQNQFDDALAAQKAAIQSNPAFAPASVELARLSLQAGRPAEAVQYAQSAIDAVPTYSNGHLMLARAHIANGNPKAAELPLRVLAANFPRLPVVQVEVGRLLAARGDDVRARAAFQAALTRDPVMYSAIEGLVILDVKQKRPDAARARVEAAIKAAPNQPALHILAARTYSTTGDDTAAEAALKRALAVDPNSLSAYQLLAGLYAKQRRLPEAAAEFQKVAERQPRSAYAHTAVGLMLQLQNKLPEAMQSYEKALAINPNAAIAANNLAQLYADRDEKLDIALQLAQTAKSALPRSHEVDDTLGWVYYKRKLSDMAIASFKQCVAADPKNAVYLYHLGLAYAQNGNRTQARETLEKALQIQPDFAGADDARRVLQTLRGRFQVGRPSFAPKARRRANERTEPRERSGGRVSAWVGGAKPPAEGRGVTTFSRRLWILFAVFIVYGTTIPFHFAAGGASAGEKLSTLPLSPFVSPVTGGRISIPDAVQNVLLFVPFGVLGMLSKKRTQRFDLGGVFLVTALGAALSVFVEALQLFMADRVTSVSDVTMNTAGAFAGAFGADRVIRASKVGLRKMNAAGLIDERTFYPMMVAAIVVCLFAWQPFDVTLEVGTLVSKVRLLAGDIWQFTVLTDEAVGFVQYALLSAAVAAWLHALRRQDAARRAALAAIALAAALELTQFLITSRMPGLEDVLVHAAGAVTGAGLWQWDRGGRRRHTWPWVVSAGIGVGAAMLMLSPFEIAAAPRPLRWLPFLGYYEHTTFGTLSHVVELLLVYFPIGFCFARITPPPGAFVTSVVVAAAIAVPVEYLQGWIVGRYPDITDVLFSGAGAWLGAWTGNYGALAFRRTLGALESRRWIRSAYTRRSNA